VVLKTTMLANQEKKPKDPKGDFPKAHKEVSYIFGGPDSYEPKRKKKLIAWEVLVVSPATLKYLRWSEVPITFNRGNHLDFIPKPKRYPLVVCPHHKRHQAQQSASGWRQLPQCPFS
jgi:hypothetical protein